MASKRLYFSEFMLQIANNHISHKTYIKNKARRRKFPDLKYYEISFNLRLCKERN